MQQHILIFLLFVQSLAACQQLQENTALLSDALDFQSGADSLRSPEQPGTLAIKTVLQSNDGGQSWQDISTGLPGELPIEWFLAQNGEIFFGYSDGFYHCKTGTTTPTWEKEFELSEHITGVFPGRAGLYALSSRNGVFQKIAQSAWTPAFSNPDGRMVHTLLEAADGSVFMGCDNGIFKSADRGKTWKQVMREGWVRNILEADGVLIGTGEQGILRSTDGGEYWEWVISEGGVGIAIERIEGGFAAITYNTESKSRRIRISEDAGKTWQPIDAGLPPSANIASIKQLGKELFCGHPEGIFRSSDGGKTWKLIRPSIGKKVFNLSVSGKVIYAIPRDAGC